jgi:hypothetical protein
MGGLHGIGNIGGIAQEVLKMRYCRRGTADEVLHEKYCIRVLVSVMLYIPSLSKDRHIRPDLE